MLSMANAMSPEEDSALFVEQNGRKESPPGDLLFENYYVSLRATFNEGSDRG